MAVGLRILGLDLSLTSTGWARVAGPRMMAGTLKPPGRLRGYERLEWLAENVSGIALGADLVAVEGLAPHMIGSSVLQLAGLHYVIGLELHRAGHIVVQVDLHAVKGYATGNGNADKDVVLAAAIKRFPAADLASNDAADALVIAAMAADHYGHPLAEMPAKHRAWLHGLVKKGARKGLPVITWPDLATTAA